MDDIKDHANEQKKDAGEEVNDVKQDVNEQQDGLADEAAIEQGKASYIWMSDGLVRVGRELFNSLNPDGEGKISRKSASEHQEQYQWKTLEHGSFVDFKYEGDEQDVQIDWLEFLGFFVERLPEEGE